MKTKRVTRWNDIDHSQLVAAKIAGISGLVAVVIVIFANYVLLNPLIVPRNAVDTARNILAHETQFRVATTLFLAYGVSIVVLLSALYVIFKPINRGLALLGALFRLVFAMLWLLTTLNMFSALRLIHGATYLAVFEADQLQALARFQLATSFDDYYSGLPFFGLAATVCSYLWLKSRYIPKPLAIFGVVASGWCVICAFVFVNFPTFDKTVNAYWFDSPMAIFELIVSIWLLVKGIGASTEREPHRIGPESSGPVSLRLPIFL
jgi:Domain of unknown function (DUF4386)